MTDARLDRLSPKLREVHKLARQGLTPAEIGKRLLSEFAVRTFLEDIEERLNPPLGTEG
jgi:DNA-binding CsgD family transcriptional regulator